MFTKPHAKHDTGRVALTLVFLGMVAYCCYHAISGQHGIFALLSLTKELDRSKAELDLVRAERMGLEHKVALLRPDSLDLDLLDEEARKVLVYATPDEEVYLYNRPSHNPQRITKLD